MDTSILTKAELRSTKLDRVDFVKQPRLPVRVILDGIQQNYNIGAIFRLCDGFLVERLVICGTPVQLHKRRLIQAAAGTQHWVPWEIAADAATAVHAAKAAGCWVAAVELTNRSISPQAMQPRFPSALVLGSEKFGISPEALSCADQTVAIPMRGMANSLNVATAAAIVLYELGKRYE